VADKVTIEGTHTPAVGGPDTGERREVEVTQAVRNLLRAGAAKVVAGQIRPKNEETAELVDEGVVTVPVPDAPEPPPRSGAGSGREDWAEWLAENTDVVTEGKDRTELIAGYDAWLEKQAEQGDGGS